MPSLDESYAQLVAALADFFGQYVPAAEQGSVFARVLLAGLNRESASADDDSLIAALDRVGLLEPEALAAAPAAEVRDMLEDSGIELSPGNASILVRVAGWYLDAFPEGLASADELPPSPARLRKQIVKINGIGTVTASSILLALGYPVLPPDRSTYRILVRHGWADTFTEADEISQHLGRLAGNDCREIIRLSRWFSRVGRQFCGTGTPKCDRCPLSGLLPENGPLEPEF
jgi:endonuclease III related protein